MKKMIFGNIFLSREPRFNEIDNLTSLIHPCYYGSDLFKILDNISLLEGDVIRFFMQIIDKLGQIKMATEDKSLRDMLDNCQKLVNECVKDFGSV